MTQIINWDRVENLQGDPERRPTATLFQDGQAISIGTVVLYRDREAGRFDENSPASHPEIALAVSASLLHPSEGTLQIHNLTEAPPMGAFRAWHFDLE